MGKLFIFPAPQAIVSIHVISRPCFHVITSQIYQAFPVPFEPGEPGNEARHKVHGSTVQPLHCGHPYGSTAL